MVKTPSVSLLDGRTAAVLVGSGRFLILLSRDLIATPWLWPEWSICAVTVMAARAIVRRLRRILKVRTGWVKIETSKLLSAGLKDLERGHNTDMLYDVYFLGFHLHSAARVKIQCGGVEVLGRRTAS